jgi:hypothetical protein
LAENVDVVTFEIDSFLRLESYLDYLYRLISEMSFYFMRLGPPGKDKRLWEVITENKNIGARGIWVWF